MEREWTVAPVRGLSDEKGSGVALGGGYWLTALHLLNGEDLALVRAAGIPA